MTTPVQTIARRLTAVQAFEYQQDDAHTAAAHALLQTGWPIEAALAAMPDAQTHGVNREDLQARLATTRPECLDDIRILAEFAVEWRDDERHGLPSDAEPLSLTAYRTILAGLEMLTENNAVAAPTLTPDEQAAPRLHRRSLVETAHRHLPALP